MSLDKKLRDEILTKFGYDLNPYKVDTGVYYSNWARMQPGQVVQIPNHQQWINIQLANRQQLVMQYQQIVEYINYYYDVVNTVQVQQR